MPGSNVEVFYFHFFSLSPSKQATLEALLENGHLDLLCLFGTKIVKECNVRDNEVVIVATKLDAVFIVNKWTLETVVQTQVIIDNYLTWELWSVWQKRHPAPHGFLEDLSQFNLLLAESFRSFCSLLTEHITLRARGCCFSNRLQELSIHLRAVNNRLIRNNCYVTSATLKYREDASQQSSTEPYFPLLTKLLHKKPNRNLATVFGSVARIIPANTQSPPISISSEDLQLSPEQLVVLPPYEEIMQWAEEQEDQFRVQVPRRGKIKSQFKKPLFPSTKRSHSKPLV